MSNPENSEDIAPLELLWDGSQPVPPEYLSTQSIIHVGNFRHMRTFEDGYLEAGLLEKPGYYDLGNWVCRPALDANLRPKTYHGEMNDVTIFTYPDSFELHTLVHPRVKVPEDPEFMQAHTHMFQVVAGMNSTGRGVFDTLEAHVWLSQSKPEGPISRTIEIAPHSQQSVIELIEQARLIGTRLLRQAIRRPLTNAYETGRGHKGRK